MGFFNIQDILAQDLTSLHLLKDYSEQWYLEFTSFLQRNGLLYLMDKG